MGGGVFEGNALYFCGWTGGGGGWRGGGETATTGSGGEGVFFSIQWAVGFCENVLFSAGDGPSQNAVCSNGICLNEKKVPIFRRELFRKK